LKRITKLSIATFVFSLGSVPLSLIARSNMPADLPTNYWAFGILATFAIIIGAYFNGRASEARRAEEQAA